MRVFRKLSGVLALTLLLALPARAFVLKTVDLDGQRAHPRWAASSLPISFMVSGRSLELLPNLAASSTPLAAIEAAMRAWSIPPVEMRLGGMSNSLELGRDGVSLITFADTPANRAAVGNFWGSTLFWTARQGSQLSITEADVVLNSQSPFATSGAPDARDIQDLVTHELGHALGLEHSPIATATMFPFGAVGQTSARSLETDDLAGLRALYGADPQPTAGAIAGRVTTPEGAPIYGAHVVATDADGIARVGVLTEPDGGFTLPSLPAGGYQVYAEPLDGPMTPASLTGGVFDDLAHPLRVDFRTAFAGSPAEPATVRVAAGATTALDPIRVVAQPPSLNPQFIAWSPDGRTFSNALGLSLQVASGSSTFLAVLGSGLAAVPASDVRVSGRDVALDATGAVRGAAGNGVPFAIFPLSVRPGARPGGRNLYVIGPSERAAFSGAIEVVAP
jgi:Carboxypeptidase regulatory-like domain/Matrixin